MLGMSGLALANAVAPRGMSLVKKFGIFQQDASTLAPIGQCSAYTDKHNTCSMYVIQPTVSGQ